MKTQLSRQKAVPATRRTNGKRRRPAYRIDAVTRMPASTATLEPKVDTDQVRNRLRILAFVFAALAVTVGVRLWYLQILDNDRFEAQATSNKSRTVHEEAPRGRILAADGSVLVDNRMSLQLGIDPARVPDGELDDVIARLAPLLGTTPEEISKRMETPKDTAVEAIPIADDVPQDLVIRIKENQEDFPGVTSMVRPERIVTAARVCENEADPATCRPVASHLLGYVGETNSGDLERSTGYRMGDTIGRDGIESAYEADLRGNAGRRDLVVNSLGRQIGPPVSERAPVQGLDVVTSIDPKIQEAAETALEQGIFAARRKVDRANTGKPFVAPAGAVVVLDPTNGAIVASASYPTYDPGAFVGGIAPDRWKWLNDPANQFPLTNRAASGLYPPASTFKVVTAMSALQYGLITRGEKIKAGPYFEAGRERRRFRDWNPAGHGITDMRKSLVESVDVYYYRLGYEMYQRRAERWFLQDTARSVGLGAKLGADIVGERAGRVPDEDWKRLVNNENPQAFPDPTWYPGDSINMSIGQGDLLVTPLQMATIFGAIANGGTIWQPHVGRAVQRQNGAVAREVPPKALGQLPIAPDLVQAMADDLRGVTTEGTAEAAFKGYPMDQFPIAGKTGTAERKPKQDTAWFVSFAPANEPKYVIAVVVEEAGHGGNVAAPISRLIYEQIFGIASTGLKEGAVTD